MSNDNPEQPGGIPLGVSGAGAATATVAVPPATKGLRLAVIAMLVTLVAGVLALDVYYIVSKKSLSDILPPAAVLTRALPPSYVTSFYGVSGPVGVAVSPDAQRVYVAESEGDRLVRAFDRTGQQLFTISPPGSSVLDRAPVYVAVDSQGQVYVADRQRHRIYVYNSDGRFVREVEPPAEAPFAAPIGVAFDRAGNLLVADASKDNHTVVVLDPQGKLVRRLGKYGEEPGQFLFPNQAAADSRGRLYVSNGNNGRVDVFGADGQFVGVLAAGSGKGAVNMPRGIFVDQQERLFVVDSIGSAVQVFDVGGDNPGYLYAIGSEGIGNGQMRYPTAVAVDSTGRVYIADRVNQRLQVWTY